MSDSNVEGIVELSESVSKLLESVERVNCVVGKLCERLQVCENYNGGLHVSLQSAVYDQTNRNNSNN